jgi:hypothetical protein
MHFQTAGNQKGAENIKAVVCRDMARRIDSWRPWRYKLYIYEGMLQTLPSATSRSGS